MELPIRRLSPRRLPRLVLLLSLFVVQAALSQDTTRVRRPLDAVRATRLLDAQLTTVPRLVGGTPELASRLLEAARLTLGQPIGRECSSDDAGMGVIIRQNPRADTTVARYTPVYIVVREYCPVPGMDMPDVRSMSLNRALDTLRALGLKPARPDVRDQFQVPALTVLDQRPQPHAPVQRGALVNLMVASEWTEVPDLAPVGREGVTNALASVQLRFGAESNTESEAPAGAIVGQDPLPHTRVPKNSAVSITTAAQAATPPPPPPFVAVPPVVGLAQDRAIGVLQSFGFSAGVITTRPAAGTPGVVIEQTPPGSSAAPAGSSVSLVVSQLSLVAVPDVAGMTREQAQAVLESAQLQLVMGADVRTRERHAGTIAAQAPAAGDSAPAQSAVMVNLAVAPVPWVEILIGVAVLAIVGWFIRGQTSGKKPERAPTQPLPQLSTRPVRRAPRAAANNAEHARRRHVLQLAGNPRRDTYRIGVRDRSASTREARHG